MHLLICIVSKSFSLVVMSQHSVELRVEVSTPEFWRSRDSWSLGKFTVQKSISWIVIGCWSRNGHTCVYVYQLIFSTGTGFVLGYRLAHWAETFWPVGSLVHRSGWVCLSSGGSWSRPSDMDSRKPPFMSCMLRLAVLESQGKCPHRL